MASTDPNMEETTSKVRNVPDAIPIAQDSASIDIVIRSNQLDEMEDLTSALVTPNRLRPLARRSAFNGMFRIHGLPDFCTFEMGYGCSVGVNIHYDQADDRIGFILASKGEARLTISGLDYGLSSQSGVVMTAGPPRVLNYLDACETSVLVMNKHKVAEQCTKLLGHDLDRELAFDTMPDLSSLHGQSWVRLFQYATAELANPHSLFRSITTARQQLEQTVLTGFLLSQTHTYSDALLRPQSAAVPFYVKRAEAYIEAHFADPLSLADIAAQAGVSARSLQNGFQNFRNTTPMAFLRSVRLQRAHRALLAADPGTDRVTEIALACGFNHMGEFATAYRRTFGETPKQTLVKSVYR